MNNNVVTPNTDVRLLKCPIEHDNKNQLTFTNKAAQYNYFNSLPKLEVSDFTYLRKDNYIRYSEHIDTILEYNYVMYRNTNYSDKWFYAFITRMEYVSNSVTNIYIETDVYQTWMFDLVYKKSFVEREHVSNDTVGLHTIDEGLSTGEYLQVQAPTEINQLNQNEMAICVAVSDYPNFSGDPPSSSQSTINGIYSGLTYCVFYYSQDYGGLASAAAALDHFLALYDQDAKAAAINAIFMVPKAYIWNNATVSLYNFGGDNYFYIITSFDSYTDITNTVSINLNSSLAESYTPVNNKLKVFPYNYLLVSNNAGIDTIFHYEDFVSNTPAFKVIGSVTPGCSIKCIPRNYLKISDTSGVYNSFNYGLAGGKLPVCPWVNDTYTNWLTQNGVSQAVKGLTSVGEIGAGAAMIGGVLGGGVTIGAGLVAAGLGGITQSLIDNHKASLAPDQANGDITVGDVTFSAGKAGFTAYQLSIRKERAQAIDNYFSMFGYKVNTLKVPELNTRLKWNYIKTIDINIEAMIPQEDLQKIKDMFNNGVTLWHDPSHYLDYSQVNSIV